MEPWFKEFENSQVLYRSVEYIVEMKFNMNNRKLIELIEEERKEHTGYYWFNDLRFNWVALNALFYWLSSYNTRDLRAVKTGKREATTGDRWKWSIESFLRSKSYEE